MKAPLLARALGAAFLLVGILSVVPFAMRPAGQLDEYITLSTSYGFVFGLFPVNALHDAFHAAAGLWGIAASFNFRSAVRYCRAVTWIYAVLVVLGSIPITNTLFGAMPVYGNDIWLHGLVAAIASYGGYGAASIEPKPEKAQEPSTPPPAASTAG
jgi:hypothetical protein